MIHLPTLWAQSSTAVCPGIAGVPRPIREHFQLNFSAFFFLDLSSKFFFFCSDLHIILLGLKVKPQQSVEHFSRAVHLWFMLDGQRQAAWFHLSSSSTQWNALRGFPTCDDSSILRSTVLSVKCGHSLLFHLDAGPQWTQTSSQRPTHFNSGSPSSDALRLLLSQTNGADGESSYCRRPLINSIPYLKYVRNYNVPLFTSFSSGCICWGSF